MLLGGVVQQGTLTLGNKVIDGSNERTSFVAVFDAQGTQTWVRRVSSSGGTYVASVAFDPTGNVVAGGQFSGTMTCATTPCPTSSSANAEPVVREYDGTGVEQWTHHFVTGETGSVTQIGARSDGHLIIMGDYSGSITLVGTTYNAPGQNNYFVVDVGPQGNGTWAFTLGSHGYDFAFLAMRPDDGFFIAGKSGGPISVAGVSTGGASDGGAFAFSFSSTGTPLWASSFAATAGAGLFGAASDGQGELIVSGLVSQGFIDFGAGPISNAAMTTDAVVAKLGQDGSLKWAKQIGGDDNQYAYFVASNSAGRVAAPINFHGSIDVGLGPQLNSGPQNEALIANFQP